ncbi:MAG: pitrilysin family protein [Nitrospiraceae bacterium]|nr:pitrilysin family protein [Nitrospiraceae bacterium]
MKNRLIVACVLVFTLLLSTAVFAEPLGKRIVLENGMVLLLAEKHDLPMVTVSMAIRAGGVSEPADKPGLAALTASLLMQGTTKRTASQISTEIDFIGGSLGVSGGDDFASANLRVLSKDLRTGLDLLSDVLMHPVFDQKEIDRKVKETLASIRQQKEEPEVIAGEAFAKAVFGNHPYGRVNDDVAAFLPKVTRQDVVDFHARRYGPNDCIIAVVGDVSEKEIIALLNEYFRDWKPAENSDPKHAAPPVIEKVTVRKMEKAITQANIAIGQVGISRGNPDFYAVTVMNYILGGGGFSSRLMDNIRDNRGLAYDVHSSFSPQKEPGAFRIWTQTKSESANEAIAEIFKELRRIRTEPVSDKELADAKAYLTGSFPLRMDTYAKIAGILTNIEIYNLGLDYPQKYAGLINAVTKDDILRVAKTYIDPDRMVVVVLGDQEKIKLKL